MDNYNYNYQQAPVAPAPQSAKASFTPASIFFLVAGFFGFITNVIAVDYRIYESFAALGILASLGLMAIGVFLIIRKIDIGNLAAIGATATLSLIAFFATFDGTLVSWLSNYSDDVEAIAALPVLTGLLYTASFALFSIFALAKFLPAGNPLIGMKKVWFVPLICGIVAAVFEFIYCCIMLAAFDELSYFIDDDLSAKYVLEIFCAIFLAVAIALTSKWFKGVLEEKALEVPAQPVVNNYAQPVYAEPAAPVYAQPVYKAPVQPAPQEPAYQVPVQPAAPIYAAPVQEQPVYAEPAQPVVPVSAPPAANSLAAELEKYKSLYEQGLISQEEYNAKRAQLLNL